jgi:hypothetical protein
LIARVKNEFEAYATFMICAAVPQPWEGRCWNTPSESRSPQGRLFMFDSTRPASNPASITLLLAPSWRPTR